MEEQGELCEWRGEGERDEGEWKQEGMREGRTEVL
jgi:hypothetical protein